MQRRGVQRKKKHGLGSPAAEPAASSKKAAAAADRKREAQEARVRDMIDRTIEYLDDELNILLAQPGMFREVLSVSKSLRELRQAVAPPPVVVVAAQPPDPAEEERERFRLGADDQEPEGV